ncbi:S-adenosyl-L-methionine-dependent methyltransferase [Dentipellis sp. KUC8613]|nr:S-adenosyl-L-methionine-dependent methyltransferase [Dentipellis sp. KUC8613]
MSPAGEFSHQGSAPQPEPFQAQTPIRAGYAPTSGETEWARLDAMHIGITQFIDGRLTPAPIENSNPRRILELGAGSGAWAIQAAQQFPEAEVIASDINPLPSRPLPPNMRFERADLTQPLPFAPASFDIVHLRLVLCHIPHGHTLLPRLAALVAPGGWLLIDDGNMPTWALTGDNDGGAPNMRRCIEGYDAYMRANEQDPAIAESLVGYLRALREKCGFGEVWAARTDFLINDALPDPAQQRLSEILRESMRRIYTNSMAPAVRAYGITPEAQRGYIEEAGGTEWRARLTLLVTWTQKAVEA